MNTHCSIDTEESAWMTRPLCERVYAKFRAFFSWRELNSTVVHEHEPVVFLAACGGHPMLVRALMRCDAYRVPAGAVIEKLRFEEVKGIHVAGGYSPCGGSLN